MKQRTKLLIGGAWADGHDRFETVPVPATAPAVVPEPDNVQKMF